MKREALRVALQELLEADAFQDYCPNGLQVEGKEEIKRIATAVSANNMTIEKAVEQGVDALIVHHGLFWKNDPYPLVGSKKKKIALLLQHEISLFAYHLPLDAHPEIGNNWRAARDWGWENLEPFGIYNGVPIGVRGTFPPQSIDTLILSLEKYYNHPAAQALGGGKHVKSGALVSGGAYRELSQAVAAGVDCFITGNFDEPAWGMAYEEGIHFLALGHTATERVGPRALGEHIKKQYGLESVFLDVLNPF